MPTVLVPGVLRAEAGGTRLLEVGDGGTLAAVLDEIKERWPRLERRIRDENGALRRYVNVYVDGEDCRRSGGLATPVPASGHRHPEATTAGQAPHPPPGCGASPVHCDLASAGRLLAIAPSHRGLDHPCPSGIPNWGFVRWRGRRCRLHRLCK